MNKYLLKIFIIVAICYFNVMSGSTAVAQVKTDTSKTWISKEGKLVSLHYSYDSTELGKNFELLEFRNGQAEHKRVLLKDILMRLMTTVDNLEKNRSRYELIIDVGALKEKYLQAAEELDRVLNINSLPDSAMFVMKDMTVLAEVLNEVLKEEPQKETSKDTIASTIFHVIDLYRPLYGNQFYSRYYKKVFESDKNSTYSKLDIANYRRELQSFENKLNDLITSIDKFDEESAKKMSIELKNHPLYMLFAESWFTQLLWLNQGAPNLNPFDRFSSVDYLLSKYSKSDLIYMRYLQSQIDRKLGSDISGKYIEFRSLLEEVQKYPVEGKLLIEEVNLLILDSLKVNQKNKFEALKTGTSYVNQIKVLAKKDKNYYENPRYRIISASDIKTEKSGYENLGFLRPRQDSV